jgi:hypothetical protein
VKHPAKANIIVLIVILAQMSRKTSKARTAKQSKPEKVSQDDDEHPTSERENATVTEDSSSAAGGDHDVAASKTEGGGGGGGRGENEAVDHEETWDIVRVVPTAEEKLKCRHEKCNGQAVAVWASSADLQDEWPLCEECQLQELGGWPEGVDPVERELDASDPGSIAAPVISQDEDNGAIERNNDDSASTTGAPPENATDVSPSDPSFVSTSANDSESHCSSGKEAARAPSPSNVASTSDSSPLSAAGALVASAPRSKNSMPQAAGECDIDDDPSTYDEEDEQFDLKEILSVAKIQTDQIVCSGGDEGCTLLACCVWVSSAHPKKWYYCIDCQKRDFGGWPELEELPISHMDESHMQFVANKCSRKRAPAMPSFTTPPPSGACDGGKSTTSPRSKPNTHFVTPPQNSLAAVKGGATESIVVGAKNPATSAKHITPVAGGAAAAPKIGKASANALATHKKWQKEAELMGSKDSRIIIDRKVAKKVVLDALHDSFRPTNINDLYQVRRQRSWGGMWVVSCTQT